MGKQTAAAITKYNDDDPSASLQIIQKDIPTELQDGEVLVRLKLRPINPSDMFCMRGRYGGFTPDKLPAVPGLEGDPHLLHACMHCLLHARTNFVCKYKASFASQATSGCAAHYSSKTLDGTQGLVSCKSSVPRLASV